MSALRWGSLVVSSGLMILPRLLGADAPIAPAATAVRAGSETKGPIVENVAAANVAVSPRPTVADAGGVRTKSSANVRRAILEAFPYKPLPREEPQPEQSSPILVRSQPGPPDPEVVVMANLEVNERAFERGLPAAIVNWRDPRPINNSRFGTGTRQKDFGKVRASVTTILYVPIFFGLSW